MIKKLIREDGSIVEREEEMAAVVTNYFTDLFTSCAGQRMEELLDRVVPRITPDMNDELNKPYTAEEVKEALFSIGDLKAPGPDGMAAIFYKKY
jgi:hypothetical protein